MSYSIERRRRLGSLAITLAISVGSLAIPAAALAADGAIDPSFNGSGYHFATDGTGISLDPVVDRVPTVRVPTVVQSDGKVVIGGRGADNFMTLVRYNADGTLDTSFGTGGFVKRQFPVTPGTVANPPALGPSGAVAMTQDASGNLFVAGIGGGASEFVARFTSSGTYVSSAVCYAPQSIAYTPRAIAVRADGRIVIAGAARDRRLDPNGTAVRTMYGQRAVVTLPASGNSTTGCGLHQATLGSDGVTIDGLGHDGTVTDAALSGRWYDGVVVLPDYRYVVVSTNDSDGTTPGAAWVQRYTAAGSAARYDVPHDRACLDRRRRPPCRGPAQRWHGARRRRVQRADAPRPRLAYRRRELLDDERRRGQQYGPGDRSAARRQGDRRRRRDRRQQDRAGPGALHGRRRGGHHVRQRRADHHARGHARCLHHGACARWPDDRRRRSRAHHRRPRCPALRGRSLLRHRCAPGARRHAPGHRPGPSSPGRRGRLSTTPTTVGYHLPRRFPPLRRRSRRRGAASSPR